MHLLEAMLVLAAASGDAVFREEADRLYALARDRFIAQTGTLAEFFEDDWRRPESIRIEPGHHFEWAWLLKRYVDLGGPAEAKDIAGALFDFANAHGVDPSTRLAYDAIDRSGQIVEADHRIWGQLEAIKAWLAMAEIRGLDAKPAIDAIASKVFEHYLDPAFRGLWMDHVSHDLQPRAAFAPTSTFYHVFLSFSELLKAFG